MVVYDYALLRCDIVSTVSITSKKTIIIITALKTSNLRYFYRHDNSLYPGKLSQFSVERVEFSY
jgi:hypothetical protein